MVELVMQPINSMQNNLQGMVRGLNMPTYQASLGQVNAINSMNGINNQLSDNAMSNTIPNIQKILANLG